MVALRKDVKVGLTIGAIAVSVIGVYAGLSALATDKAADNDTAKLNVSPMDGTRKGAKADSKVDADGPTVADRTSTKSNDPKADAGKSSTAIGAPATPIIANSGDQVAQRPAPSGTEDPWLKAFGSGTVAPTVTVTPDPGKAAIVDRAADRADTIKQLNGQPADATKADAGKIVASAGDTSGSMNTANTTAVLAKAGVNTTTTPPSSSDKSHTVVSGETLSAISSEYYGDAKYFSQIIAANPQVNPNKLKPGTVLRIPALAKKEEKSDTVDLPATASAASIDSSKQYVVKSGDSLHKIASELYNDSAMSTKIYEANKTLIGADPAKLKVGMVLALPSAPTVAATAKK